MCIFDDLVNYILSDKFISIWKELIVDKELYFKLNKKTKNVVFIYYNGIHILSLQYYKLPNYMVIKDVYKNEFTIDKLSKIVLEKKKEQDMENRHFEHWEDIYKYRYSALDKRVIFTELLYYYRTRVDLILADDISKKIIFIELKRLNNPDFGSGKAYRQIIRYNDFLKNNKNDIDEEMNEIIAVRKKLGLFELNNINRYEIESKPVSFIIECENIKKMEKHCIDYTNNYLDNISGLIYTNKMIKINTTKYNAKNKLYYEF